MVQLSIQIMNSHMKTWSCQEEQQSEMKSFVEHLRYNYFTSTFLLLNVCHPRIYCVLFPKFE